MHDASIICSTLSSVQIVLPTTQSQRDPSAIEVRFHSSLVLLDQYMAAAASNDQIAAQRTEVEAIQMCWVSSLMYK